MKRALPLVLCTAIALAFAGRASAQSDLLKPFRPGAYDPTKEEPAKPAAPKPKAEAPKPKEEPAKDPAGEPDPVRPPIAKPAAPAEPAAPADPPAAVRPKVVPPPEPKVEDPIEDEIVVRPGVTPTAPDQVQLRTADSLFSRKMYRDAAPEYTRFLEVYPRAAAEDRQAALYRLAECYRLIGAMNNARANYEAVLFNYGGGDFVGYAASRLGKILYDEKDYRNALSAYRKASVRLKQPTLINDAKFFIGRCQEALGQKTEARVQYEDLAAIGESNPYREASRLSVGRIFEDGGQKENALKWLQPLSEDSTNAQIKAEALARTALLQVDTGQYKEAAPALDAAVALPEAAPWKDRLQFAQFRLLSLQKQHQAVLDRYGSGAANGFNLENKLNVLVLVGEAYRALNQRDAAMGIYDQIAREFATTPQARDAAYARLVMLYETNDARLLDEVNKFLTENPTAPQVERVSLMKAEALFKAGDFEHAAPVYQIVLEKSKGLAGEFKGEAAFKLGWCWMQLRYFDKAVETFGQFLKDFPTHAKVSTALAQRGAAHMQLKQYTAAQKDFQELTTKFRDAREREFGLENLALIYSQLGDQGRMATAFETLLRDYPETKAKAKAHFWIGCAAFDGKDYKKAIPHLTEARKLDKTQFFERASLRLIAASYNVENADATEQEISFYRENGGQAETQSDVLRWLGQKYYERGEYAKAEKFFPELIARQEAIDDDKLFLARARVKLGKYKEAVESFNTYLSSVREPILRVRAQLEKIDAQIGQKDWLGAETTVKEGLSFAAEGRYNGELRLRAGEIEVGRGNVRKALQIFESIPITLDDEEVCPKALERAIVLNRQLGQEKEAKDLENQLRSKYPEYLQKKKLAQP